MKLFINPFRSYKQAPWRNQLQMIGLFLAALVVLAIISAFYVNVTTRTALAGREIAFAKDNITSMQHEISDYESKIASLTSAQNMQARAAALGFEPSGPDGFTYIYVSGYSREGAINLSSKLIQDPQLIILPEYTESLFDWLARRGRP
jgi:hypothetical protein